MPIDRAVPAMIFSAWSRSLALRSAILVCAISRTWSRVTVATLVLCGSPEPFSTPAALSSMRAAGGVLVTKVNERSSKTEISTGMTLPRCDSVAALYALQNSMMLTPCWPSAGPTGGAGVAAPALIWSLMTAVNRFLGGMTSFFVGDGTAPVQGPGPSGGGPGAPGSFYNLATWLNDSSTGVSRPKMDTSTCSFCCSALISLMVAGSVAKGPSMTVTDSPTSKSTSVVGAAAGVPAAVSAPAAARAAGCWTAGARILTTSSSDSGDGREVAPTNPVTPGVLRTAPHDSSLSSMRTSR